MQLSGFLIAPSLPIFVPVPRDTYTLDKDVMAPPKRDTPVPTVNTRNATASASKSTTNQPVTIEYLERKFQDMEDKFTSMLQAKNAEIASLQEKVSSLETQVQALQNSLDDNDAYERRDCLVLSGSSLPVFETGEICTNLVRDLVAQKLQLNISSSEISVAHRLGQRPQSQMVDKRPIIAKFCRRDMKRDILTASRRNRAEGLYVNENLTPKRRNIFNVLRRMRKSHPGIVKGVTTYDGRVYAFTKPINPAATNPRDQRHLISDQVMLTNFCREFIKSSLDEFLERAD